MLRVLDTVERNVIDAAMLPITVADKVSTDVMPDTTKSGPDEIAYIELFNAGANRAYYAFGRECNATDRFNAYMSPGAMLEVKTRQRVSVYSDGGTIISRTVLLRKTAVSTRN